MKIETLLVPVDFSTHSQKALHYAAELGKTFGARLHLLHCHGVDMVQVFPYDPPYLANLPPDLDERVCEAAINKLADLRKQIEDRGVAVEIHLSKLLPSDAILQTAKEIGADMIVMGTRGRTGLEHVLLGSVAERTIRTAPCPVISVKADD